MLLPNSRNLPWTGLSLLGATRPSGVLIGNHQSLRRPALLMKEFENARIDIN
jgi:hypothetical protein